MSKLATILIIIGIYLISLGALWMGYEQRRANEGIFVPFPSAQTYHVQPPAAKNF